MAGRGTGHYLQKKKAGGLANQARTSRSRRVDRQLRGRAGRQSRKFEFM
jgi:preprotein translocase subunit SecA